jgi:hypothetical protein
VEGYGARRGLAPIGACPHLSLKQIMRWLTALAEISVLAASKMGQAHVPAPLLMTAADQRAGKPA